MSSYFDHLSIHVSFDPRSSVKWIQNMDLVGKILDLPIPPLFGRADMELDRPPPIKTMAENIIPVMLNKVNTSKALQCQDTTIKTLTTHIVEKSFTKLEETLFILKEKKWDRFELLDLVRKSLPDIQIIISLLGIESRKIGMTLLSLYQAYFPDWVRSSRFDVGKCLEYTSDPQLVEPVLNFLIHFPGFKWYSLNGLLFYKIRIIIIYICIY